MRPSTAEEIYLSAISFHELILALQLNCAIVLSAIYVDMIDGSRDRKSRVTGCRRSNTSLTYLALSVVGHSVIIGDKAIVCMASTMTRGLAAKWFDTKR